MTRDFIEALISEPVTAAGARRSEKEGGIPDKPGVYAWWLSAAAALPMVPTQPHPNEPGLGLLYVGISPKRVASNETLRSRALKKHLGSSLAGSTFRRALAALLWESQEWTPRLTSAGRWKFSPEHGAALCSWQHRNLRVSWVHVERPWDSEPFAITELQPPLNAVDNLDHSFHGPLEDARKRFKAHAEQLRSRRE